MSVTRNGRTDPPVEATMSEYGRDRIARNALWRVAASGGSELLSIFFFVFLGRLLTPADFGVVAIAGVFLLTCQVILRTGFSVAVIQRERLEPAHLDGAFWANLALALLLAVLLIAGSAPVAVALGEPSLMPVMAALAPTLVLSGAAWIFHARFKREMRYDIVLWSMLASIFGGGLVGVLLAISGAAVWSLVGQQLTGALLALLVLVACSPWKPRLRLSRSHVRDLASFSVKVAATQGLEFVSQRAVSLILAFFMSAHTVGLYVIASRLVWTLASLSMFVIFDLSLVVLSRLQSRPERHREGAYYTLRMTTLLCLPMFVGAALIADPLIPLLLGVHWTESVLLFQTLSLFSIFFSLYFCGQQILISAGRPGPALRLAVISAVVVAAFTLAAARFGVVAATGAAGAASVVSLLLALRLLRRELGLAVPRLLADQCPIWLATGIMAFAVWLLAEVNGAAAAHPLVFVAIQVFCGAAVFLAVMLLLAPAYAREVGGTLRDAIRI